MLGKIGLLFVWLICARMCSATKFVFRLFARHLTIALIANPSCEVFRCLMRANIRLFQVVPSRWSRDAARAASTLSLLKAVWKLEPMGSPKKACGTARETRWFPLPAIAQFVDTFIKNAGGIPRPLTAPLDKAAEECLPRRSVNHQYLKGKGCNDSESKGTLNKKCRGKPLGSWRPTLSGGPPLVYHESH